MRKKKPVKCIKLGETEWIYFDSLQSAGIYLKEERKKDVTVKHYCSNIKQNINGKCNYAYGYVWRWAEID